MLDEGTRSLLAETRRDMADTAELISQAVSKLEEREPLSSEALLGEAMTRLRLLCHRIDERIEGNH